MKRFYLFLMALIVCGFQTATAKYAFIHHNFLVSSIVHDDQNIYIGTKNGLVVMDKETESQTLYNSTNSSLPFGTAPGIEGVEETIFSLTLHDGVLWVGRFFSNYSSFCDGVFTNYQKTIPEVWYDNFLPPRWDWPVARGLVGFRS